MIVARESGIVEDGRGRIYRALVERVRAEVEAEYVEEIKKATPWRRLFIRWKIERAVREEVKKITLPPPESLF